MKTPEKTHGEKPMWAIRDCKPVVIEILAVRRAWYHLRSGTTEWKEQSPQLFASESQAAWACLVRELGEAVISSWQDGYRDKAPFATIDTRRLAERVHLHCCRYHRAWMSECNFSGAQQATRTDAAGGEA